MDRDAEALRRWYEETAQEPLEGMGDFFSARWEQYEEHMSPWRAHYCWMADLLPESTADLLDIGCGSGLELDAIFARFPSLRVTGVDLSEPMLAKLKQKHPRKALTLVLADYFRCDLGQACFDAAVAFETLHHVTAAQKTALFGKVLRSLKPGGVFLECDYIATSQAVEDLAFAELERRKRRDGLAAEALVHFDTPLTLAHEKQALQDAGFSLVEVMGFLPGDDHTAMIRAQK